jgi:hypothetical protein
MSDKTDLYIERVLAETMPDDVKREEVRRRIQERLDSAIARAQSPGLSQEEAEEEAMAQMGEPSVAAREFGRRANLAWFAFERAAFCISFCVLLLIFLYCRIIRAHPFMSESLQEWL